MIAEHLRVALDQYPDRPFLVSAAGEQSYAEFNTYVRELAAWLQSLPEGRLACHLPDSPDLIGLMLAAGLCGRPVVLFSHDYSGERVAEFVAATDTHILVTSDPSLQPPDCLTVTPAALGGHELTATPGSVDVADDGEILILTSGTTGRPKAARYNWSQLFAQIASPGVREQERWLLAYRLNHFAGVQMLVHVLNHGSTLVLADSSQVGDAIRAIKDFGVTHVSSTPTFWRFALTQLQDHRDELPLQQITLGSEATSADLLERLQALFPAARIVQIYASTEAGSCISVSDGLPGLPQGVLNRPDDAAVQFRIVDDELHVKTRHGMRGYLGAAESGQQMDADGWRATGDLVRLEGDRVLFVGRKNETVNVGGVKVQPADVENRITPLEGVRLARAYGKANPIAGQIVAVDVVAEPDVDTGALETAIREACKTLAPAAQPRLINFVDSMQTNNFKLSRQ